jgi:hypothetical protein
LDDLEHPALDEGVQQVGQQHPQEIKMVIVSSLHFINFIKNARHP